MPSDSPSSAQLDAQGLQQPREFDEEFDRRRRRSRAWLMLVVLTPLLGFAVIFYFHGENLSASLLYGRAQERYQAGDVEGAVSDLDAAAEWAPDMPQVFELRCQIRMQELNDLEGAEADADRLIELSPEYAPAYTLRSQVYQRQTFADPESDRHRDAINDLTTAIRLSSSREPMPFNNRAYGRALAKIELSQGLEDAERSVELLDKQAAQIPAESPAQTSVRASRAAVLDTRGYLHHLLGNNEQALADLDDAIELAEQSAAELAKLAEEQGASNSVLERFEESKQQTLAVLHHHRAEIHKQLGNEEKAEADFAKAKELGYDPSSGVF